MVESLQKHRWLEDAYAAGPNVVRQTMNGLVAFIVPGRDPYSRAQGTKSRAPGGIEAGTTPVLTRTLDRFLPGPLPLSSTAASILNEFATFFGSEALKPTSFFDTQWATEPWSRGCPVGIWPPGLLLANGEQLRAPQGRIKWAGTETSNYWNGYMDGAVRSGERAAKEALADL